MTCEMELSPLTNDPRMQCLDPDLLRAFVIIADTRSFTRAAERLLRTQPAISLQMKRLEEAVGRSLLKRNPRLVRLTPAGEVLLDYARRILALNDDLLARVKEPDLVGTVRLGTPEDFATMHLSGVLARFSQAYPGVALEVTCDLTLNLIERFRQGSFDLALIMREPSLVNGGHAGVARAAGLGDGDELCRWPRRMSCRWWWRRRPASTGGGRSGFSTRPGLPGASPIPAARWQERWRRSAPASAPPCCRAAWCPAISR